MLSDRRTHLKTLAFGVGALAASSAPPTLLGYEARPQEPNSVAPTKTSEIPLKQIVIEDDFWSPRLQVNRTKTLDHVYQELETTGCIRNFDLAAGKATGSFGGPWWADSDVYKWLEGASYVHALVVIEKAPCSEYNLLTSNNEIPAGVQIVQIASKFDETFMSICNIFVDARTRTGLLAADLIKRQRYKNAGVIS